MSDTVKRVLWTAAQAFLAGFVTALAGLGPVHSFETGKAALVGAVTAGLAAAASAVKNVILTPPGHPAR